MSKAAPFKLTAEELVPRQTSILVHQAARWLHVSANHIINLIESGAIQVPAENLLRRPKTMIAVPRASMVAFIEERMSPAWHAAPKAKKKENLSYRKRRLKT